LAARGYSACASGGGDRERWGGEVEGLVARVHGMMTWFILFLKKRLQTRFFRFPLVDMVVMIL
jgi:hypothetical protein